MNLIKEYQSKELYLIQKKILSRLEKQILADDIIELALLQTMSPIEDYENAMKVLEFFKNKVSDIRICIIGAYFSCMWDYNQEYSFIEDLKRNIEYYDGKVQSIIYYIFAWSEYVRDGERNTIIDYLTKSISLYDQYVSNLLLFSEYLPREEKKQCLCKIKKNIEKIQTEVEIQEYNDEIFINPEYFWKTQIEQVWVDEYFYRENFI
ncbi:MAG: hypothetical protein Q4G58_11780 [bacterium]|nr:hypothetical protein [bacterium]